MGGAP